ncbi:MAG: MFS transporter, partial [Candidatus Puniceispirillaceae bacterium]
MNEPLLTAARRAISAGFLGLGLFMGMWGVMVPLRSADLGLSELMISAFLLIIGLSLCAAIFLVTRVKALQDDGQLIRFAGPVYAGGFTVCLVTGSLPVFFAAGVVTGLAAGFLDAGLNSQSSQWEQKARKRSMSGFHALFSLGMLIGAGLVTLLLSGGHDPAVGIVGSAAVYGAYIITNRSWVSAEARMRDNIQHGKPLRLSFAVILFLGACISLSALIEGGVIDWSALHLNRVLTLPAEDAGRAVLFFSVAMTVARFMGDRLAAMIAPNLLLAVPLVIAGVLLTTAVVTAHVTMLVWAYIFIGLAVANAFPIIISEAGRAAGDRPLREISVIVGFAYFGLISGPALFGVLAHFMGLDATVLGIAAIAFALG